VSCPDASRNRLPFSFAFSRLTRILLAWHARRRHPRGLPGANRWLLITLYATNDTTQQPSTEVRPEPSQRMERRVQPKWCNLAFVPKLELWLKRAGVFTSPYRGVRFSRLLCCRQDSMHHVALHYCPVSYPFSMLVLHRTNSLSIKRFVVIEFFEFRRSNICLLFV